MDIKTANDITPAVARQIRKRTGLTQEQFWNSVRSNQSSGQWFESGKRKGIPPAIQAVIFLRYVANLDFDVANAEDCADLIKLGRVVSARRAARRLKREADAATKAADKAAEKTDII